MPTILVSRRCGLSQVCLSPEVFHLTCRLNSTRSSHTQPVDAKHQHNARPPSATGWGTAALSRRRKGILR
ncbi:hypothetical protein E2C01_073575 [Portunus trituberculatus]|uniref:Uncharacterized protein n=1 Tax=Portunus trituberculatus TaxID=210409 RepID=A0A5B7I9T5_PORTR|nr:hypothetical protein [Portunus trituberculatus]